MIWGQGGSQGTWGRLRCCHRNNLQPWPWAGVRGQREVTTEAMIMVKGGGGGWLQSDQRGWDRISSETSNLKENIFH